jgi:signal transduction histidine kinase
VNVFTPVVDPRARLRRSWIFDAVVTAFAMLVWIPDIIDRSPATGLLVVAMVVPLLVRRIWPVPVFAFAVMIAATFGWWTEQALWTPALAIGLYTVGALRPRREALAAAGALEVGVIVAAIHSGGSRWWALGITLTAIVVAALVLGLYVGTRRVYLAELRDRADRLERERDQQGALAAAAERARIAREMHDIVAHHLTVMVALADGAAAASVRSPERAAEVMRTVSATGREALADTRRLLGVLRDDLPGDVTRSPLPVLADLDELFDRVREAGLPVRYEAQGVPPAIAPGVALTVYRLVQEALTNTMKHAGAGASAIVRLRYSKDDIHVEVTDNGSASTVRSTTGRGLVGMRERVASFGGEMQTGPGEHGGWFVSATIAFDQSVPK